MLNAYAELFTTEHIANTLMFLLIKLECCAQHKDIKTSIKDMTVSIEFR